MDAVGSRGGLHLTAEVVLLLARSHLNMMIHYLLTGLLGLQTTEPLTDQIFDLRVSGVDVTNEGEGEVRRVRKTLFVHLEGFVQRHALKRLHRHEDRTLRVIRGHHLYGVGERDLGVLIAVSELTAQDVKRRLISLLVTTRSGEIEIHELEHRLKILDGRRAGQALQVLVYLRRNGDSLTREGFYQLGSVERADTGHLHDHRSQLSRRQIFGLHERHSTVRESLHKDLVSLEIGLFEDHLDTIGERPFDGADGGVLAEVLDLTLTRCFLHKLGVHLLLLRCLDSQLALSRESC